MPLIYFIGGDKKLRDQFCIRMQVKKKKETVPAYLEVGKNGGLTIPKFRVRDVRFIDATHDEYITFGNTRIFLADDNAEYNSRVEIIEWIESKVTSTRRMVLLKKTANGKIETIRKKRKIRPHRKVRGPNKSVSFKHSNICVKACNGNETVVKTKTEQSNARVARRCVLDVLSGRTERVSFESASSTSSAMSHITWNHDGMMYFGKKVISIGYDWKSEKLKMKVESSTFWGNEKEKSVSLPRKEFWCLRSRLKTLDVIETNKNEKSVESNVDMCDAFERAKRLSRPSCVSFTKTF